MSDPCTGLLSCSGESVTVPTESDTIYSLTQVKNRTVNMTVGGLAIPVQVRKRNFAISSTVKSLNNVAAVVHDLNNENPSSYYVCQSPTTTYSGQVSESYECLDSVIYFMDLRYNNFAIKEVHEILTFGLGGSDTAAFKEPFGTGIYSKFKIVSANIVRTTTYYQILNGGKKVLTVNNVTVPLYSAGSPLILVFPNVPSLATPLDADIKQYGFYDYNAIGGDGLQDGGKDYYFPAWCRQLGTANQTLDVQEATDRYSSVFLLQPYPATGPISPPPIATDVYYGSIAVDPKGNIFTSQKIDGNIFNTLINFDGTAADPVQITGIIGSNPLFYPVSII